MVKYFLFLEENRLPKSHAIHVATILSGSVPSLWWLFVLTHARICWSFFLGFFATKPILPHLRWTPGRPGSLFCFTMGANGANTVQSMVPFFFTELRSVQLYTRRDKKLTASSDSNCWKWTLAQGKTTFLHLHISKLVYLRWTACTLFVHLFFGISFQLSDARIRLTLRRDAHGHWQW